MALESGFFNSANGDRLYNAEDISRYFENIMSSGIFKRITDCLKVSAGSGMTLTVAPGAGLIDCHWFRTRTAESVTIPTANAVLPRFDIVVARLDMSDAVRAITLMVVSGTPAQTPTAPEPVRTATVHDLVLALVYVPAGASEIVEANLTDVRENEWYCGYVHSLVDTPVLQTLHSRYRAPVNNTVNVPINIVGYNVNVDILNVYVEGFRMAPVQEYSVDEERNMVVLVEPLDAGTLIDIEVFKPTMPEDVPTTSGTVHEMAQEMTNIKEDISNEQSERIAAFAQVAPIGPGVFAFEGSFMISGFISSTSKRMYFSIPFNRLIDATGFTVLNMPMQVRQGGKYILGSANTWYDISADIFTATISKNGMITISCEPSFVDTPINNESCAIHIEANAEIEFT